MLFNDVAEFQRMPRFDPTLADAYRALPEVIAGAVFDGAILDEARLGPPMKLLLHMVKGLAVRGLERDAMLALLASESPDADNGIEAGLRAHFEALDLAKARVLCVTTEPNNVVMWGNYAEAHAGCVLGFRHIATLSTPLLEARPVAYAEDSAIVGSGVDFLLYGNTEELRTKTLDAVCFTKKLAWSSEREWRAMTWRPKEQEQYGDYQFYSEELESVTLGARASQSTEANVRALVASRYPSTALYRMHSLNGELARHALPVLDGDA